MEKKFILFDLDGTLTDPSKGITNSVIYSLNKFDITVENRADLYKMIGPPLRDSFERYFGFSKEKANLAVQFYREYYKNIGLYENSIYAGIPELLKNLNNKSLILATSKPTVFAVTVLEHLNLSDYFAFISGSELNGTRADKAEIISYALKQCKITDTSQAVMVGDRSYDIIGAKQNCVASIGVLYGFGKQNELAAAGADYIANNVTELKNLLTI